PPLGAVAARSADGGGAVGRGTGSLHHAVRARSPSPQGGGSGWLWHHHASSRTGSSCRMVTTPRPPSTRIRAPSLILVVALPVPTTAGRPYSRATIAMWLIDPPMSLTAAAIFWKIGLQVGFVTWHTRMSPCRMRPISATDLTTRAV